MPAYRPSFIFPSQRTGIFPAAFAETAAFLLVTAPQTGESAAGGRKVRATFTFFTPMRDKLGVVHFIDFVGVLARR
jgi:hypothetical protein